MQIKFSDQSGTILESSPHGNYLVVQLSLEVTICGTFSNQWNWEESSDIDSGFTSFITYIGVNYNTDLSEIYQWIEENSGYFKITERYDESKPRESKRNDNYPLELKVRGLHSQSIPKLISFLENYLD